MGKLSSLRPTSAKLRLAKQGFGRRSPALRDEDGLYCCHIFCPAMAGFGPAERDLLTSFLNFAELRFAAVRLRQSADPQLLLLLPRQIGNGSCTRTPAFAPLRRAKRASARY
jgi:hypothetical protein